jgi:hypothetical protein
MPYIIDLIPYVVENFPHQFLGVLQPLYVIALQCLLFREILTCMDSKVRSFHGGDCEECRLLGYKNPVFTSQEKHYVSAVESSWLMLCKIRGFHGGDCQVCRFLGYKTPVRTSQEKHYVSAVESS